MIVLKAAGYWPSRPTEVQVEKLGFRPGRASPTRKLRAQPRAARQRKLQLHDARAEAHRPLLVLAARGESPSVLRTAVEVARPALCAYALQPPAQRRHAL